MKKILSIIGVLGIFTPLFSQNAVQDSVIMGAVYANEVYYSLSDGEKSLQPKADWHLAFSTSSFSASVLSNADHTVIKFLPDGENLDFTAAIDTTGYHTWDEAFNDPEDWEEGALNQGPEEYGWGYYDQATHTIIGNSIVLVEVDETHLYKLNIVSKYFGVYVIQYALYDHTGTGTELTINSPQYAPKEFVFLNIADGELKDREMENWDMWFTRFHDEYGTTGEAGIQTVTGILTDRKWEVAAVNVGAGNQNDATDYSVAEWGNAKNAIGDKYKALDENFAWSVTDSTVYYLKNAEGEIWKWYPTHFVGTAEGKTVFVKEKLAQGVTGINDIPVHTSFLDVYPNPATNQITLVFDSKSPRATIIIRNYLGQEILKLQENTALGIEKVQLNIDKLNRGVYLVEFIQNEVSTTAKVIKQ